MKRLRIGGCPKCIVHIEDGEIIRGTQEFSPEYPPLEPSPVWRCINCGFEVPAKKFEPIRYTHLVGHKVYWS